MEQNTNDLKSHIWNYFFENVTLGLQHFDIRPHVPVDIIGVLFNFRSPTKKSGSQKKPAKKITHFIIQFLLKKSHSVHKPQLT